MFKEIEINMNKAIELYNSGKSVTKIAKELNISETTLYYRFKKNNFKFKERGWACKINVKKENEDNIIKLYNNGYSSNKLSKMFKLNQSIILKILHSNSIKIRDNSESKREFNANHSFFSKQTEESCYWAGFIAADGCIYENSLIINLQSRDILHLEKLKKILNSNKIIKCKKRKKDKFWYVSFKIGSKELANDLLNNFNITPKKSLILEPPNLINNELIRHFIRGYLDGDGCINNKKKNSVSFAGTRKFLQWIKENLQNNIQGIGNPKIRDLKNNKVKTISFYGKIQSPKIIEWLYNNSNTNIRLDRKYEIALRYLKLKNENDLKFLQLQNEREEKYLEMINLYEKGLSIEKIAKILCASSTTIRKCLKSNNIKIRIANLSKKQIDEILRLYNNTDLSINKISVKTKISYRIVKKYLIQNNIELRKKKFSHEVSL